MTIGADTIAAAHHAGQTDRGGRPYIGHVRAVALRASRLAARLDLPPEAVRQVMDVGLLHDVIEDTPATAADLIDLGVEPDTVRRVLLLTRPPEDARPYAQCIDDLVAAGDLIALVVKLADTEHNGDPARLACLPDGGARYGLRYARAALRLREAIATLTGVRLPAPDAGASAAVRSGP